MSDYVDNYYSNVYLILCSYTGQVCMNKEKKDIIISVNEINLFVSLYIFQTQIIIVIRWAKLRMLIKKRNYCKTHEFISKSKNQLYSNVTNKWCLQLIKLH